MYKKILFLGLATSLLGGCDTGSSDNKVEQKQQEQVAPKASSTAIFFPGGGGIDFGFDAAKNEDSKPDSRGRVSKRVRFDFDSSHSVVDIEKTISKVMMDQGYRKVERKVTNNKLIYDQGYYIKSSDTPINFRYRNMVKEGFYNKIQVTISWYK